jgi:HAE1 family hydrophobic/amphiphilic exporter-1
VQDIAQALNTMIGGQNVSTFDVGEDQYDVTLRASEPFRTNLDGLKRLTVFSTRRGAVTLGEIVRVLPATGPSSIQRLNRQRQVTLSANLIPGASQGAVLSQLQLAVDDLHIPTGYSAGPAGGSRELGRAAGYFLIAVSLSFIFVHLVLAAQFESFIHPITILLTLPLAVPFGIFSLLVTGQSVNIFSGLGLLLLFRIVRRTRSQIDHTNGLRAGGLSRDAAILQANRDRLRPILMTTVALVAGVCCRSSFRVTSERRRIARSASSSSAGSHFASCSPSSRCRCFTLCSMICRPRASGAVLAFAGSQWPTRSSQSTTLAQRREWEHVECATSGSG